ncbi:hypothetical protein TNCV_1339381 [Trichonephila clavipes]|uniref:Uncharacterized protein n=1 Tax=Trichonephila clavipes TaxID=2585209 RepID=A0A8X6RAU6_TRICX|nr:hypothetical protein TNCV_1339381 [Trichonephila clavipes]
MGPAGGHGWFVAGLRHLRLRVRFRPKTVDFHDAENLQRPCRMIIRHQVPPSRDETGRQNYLRRLVSAYMVPL